MSNQLTPVQDFNKYMTKLKPQMSLALPKHMNADRMARLAMTAFSTNSALQECDFNSIAGAIMTAAQLGLEPHVNGAGYLIPYKKNCTFVPGWKGLADLVSRSGRGSVYTGVIYKDQRYEFIDGARRDLKILNETELDAESDITHAYAIGWVKDSSVPIIELWTMAKIIKHRDRYNKVGKRHYSYENLEMYARKIPLLQVMKYMPSSVEMANAIEVQHAAEDGRTVDIVDGIVVESHNHEGQNAKEVAEQDKHYTDAEFEKNTPAWMAVIKNGKTVADFIGIIESSEGRKFTSAQIDKLHQWKEK